MISSKLIKLPTPHFVVFYNGVERKPERRILRLSEAFEVSTKDPELELKVTILNINPEMNEELKEKCPVLKQYTQYVELVRYNSIGMPLGTGCGNSNRILHQTRYIKGFFVKAKISLCRKHGDTREQTIQELCESCELTTEEVEKKMLIYWK